MLGPAFSTQGAEVFIRQVFVQQVTFIRNREQLWFVLRALQEGLLFSFLRMVLSSGRRLLSFMRYCSRVHILSKEAFA